MDLLLLHTGGTLMMRGGDPAPLVPDVFTRDVLDELPVLRRIARIETEIVFNLDSSEMQPHHWVTLARHVHERRSRFDGVVIIHGTDTMAFTASALAFLLPDLDRPVVLTGAQKPLADVHTDARANLVDACLFATQSVPEVGVAFASRLYRGARTRKVDAWGLAAFDSPGCPPLAEIGLGVRTGGHVLPRRVPGPHFDERIESNVLAVRAFPGLSPRLLQGALGAGVRGIVLEAYGSGNVPTLENGLVPVIEHARSLDVPVVIVSQCLRGRVDLRRYEGGDAAARAGAIPGHDLTPEAALVKLMVALGRAGDDGRIRAARTAFSRDWCGECEVPG